MTRAGLFLSLACVLTVAAAILRQAPPAPQPPPARDCVFDEQAYLALNPDVAAAVRSGGFASGSAHYLRFGQGEGRAPAFGCPGTSTRGTWPAHEAARCEFDEQAYLSMNPDVAAAVSKKAFSSGWHHYQRFGRGEGRAPNFGCPGARTDQPGQR
jgi:hypothetical protein